MGVAQLEDPPKRKPEIRIKLEELEGYWKVRLNTLKPFGLNTKTDVFANKTGRKGIMMELV